MFSSTKFTLRILHRGAWQVGNRKQASESAEMALLDAVACAHDAVQ